MYTKEETGVNLLMTQPEREEARSGGSKAGMITAFLLFLCIITVAFFSYQRSINPDADMKELMQKVRIPTADVAKEAQLLYTYEYDAGEKPIFLAYKSNLVKCGSSGIWFLDKTGEIIRSEGLIYSNPIVKTIGSQLLVADRITGEISVLDEKTVRWKEKLDTSVLNADINEDGYVTVITGAKRDNNVIRVFEPHGVELFQKVIANDFAVSANVSPSGNMLTLSGINTGAVGVFSIYKSYDMKGNDLTNLSFEESAELLPIFWYNNDDSIFAVGDRAAASIGPTGELIWEKHFRRVIGAEPVGDGRLALVEESADGTMLKIYSSEGEELAFGVLESKPEGMNAKRGTICVNTSDIAYFFNDKCKSISRYEAGSPIKQVCLLDKRQAAVITDRQVAVINVY
ncbi:MAG: hypothetical protein GXY17_10375 [Clostridiaceae bacterium]|jgi:hypothetical protein|nr:hypothetical protein [Clostridiaceae bacterium]